MMYGVACITNVCAIVESVIVKIILKSLNYGFCFTVCIYRSLIPLLSLTVGLVSPELKELSLLSPLPTWKPILLQTRGVLIRGGNPQSPSFSESLRGGNAETRAPLCRVRKNSPNISNSNSSSSSSSSDPSIPLCLSWRVFHCCPAIATPPTPPSTSQTLCASTWTPCRYSDSDSDDRWRHSIWLMDARTLATQSLHIRIHIDMYCIGTLDIRIDDMRINVLNINETQCCRK